MKIANRQYGKKTISLLIVIFSFIFIFSDLTEVSTYSESDIVVSLQINEPIMTVNGAKFSIDNSGTTPIILNGRTFVPIRAIIEAFGGVVSWDDKTKSVNLDLDGDQIILSIDKNIAYLNSTQYTLDVAPTIIEGRTMLPIRFIAEGFNLGVAWNGKSQTVYIIQNGFDADEYRDLMLQVPDYSNSAYVIINNNVPYFKSYEKIDSSFEYYSKLDDLGRCDVCMASISTDLMPTEKRESISSVIPTGWVNVKYDQIEGKYLYNRCHLIGYQLTGENANNKNLITGTRYLNVTGMLPFENMVDNYIEKTGNHVMYRSTPVFTDNNLVADGVLLEGYSLEDNGAGVSFCVYCYNVQPNIAIDYASGKSHLSEVVVSQTELMYFRTPTGTKYHIDADCGGKNSYKITLDEAKSANLTPCSKCIK